MPKRPRRDRVFRKDPMFEGRCGLCLGVGLWAGRDLEHLQTADSQDQMHMINDNMQRAWHDHGSVGSY